MDVLSVVSAAVSIIALAADILILLPRLSSSLKEQLGSACAPKLEHAIIETIGSIERLLEFYSTEVLVGACAVFVTCAVLLIQIHNRDHHQFPILACGTLLFLTTHRLLDDADRSTRTAIGIGCLGFLLSQVASRVIHRVGVRSKSTQPILLDDQAGGKVMGDKS